MIECEMIGNGGTDLMKGLDSKYSAADADMLGDTECADAGPVVCGEGSAAASWEWIESEGE